MTSLIRKLETGVPGLDTLTHGGIPEGRSTLIVGRSGTGKTILSLQIGAHLARHGLPTIVLAIEEPVDDLLITARGLGFDSEALSRE